MTPEMSAAITSALETILHEDLPSERRVIAYAVLTRLKALESERSDPRHVEALKAKLSDLLTSLQIPQHVNVPIPLFEIVGPPCKVPDCKGVLIDAVSLKTKDYFQECSICKAHFNRVPAWQKLKEVNDTIARILAKESES